jgi:hypothetical protein
VGPQASEATKVDCGQNASEGNQETHIVMMCVSDAWDILSVALGYVWIVSVG